MPPRWLIGRSYSRRLFLAAAAPAMAQAPQPAPYVDGPVTALLVEGETLYVGGAFSVAGSAAGPAGARATRTAGSFAPIPGSAAGRRSRSARWRPTARGGWFAGGTFERVDGWERGGLVHLLADGSVDPDFHVEIAGTVEALALDGSTLWVGGTSLTALDAATGARLEQQPPALAVDALAVAGDRLFVAGPSGLTALDGATVAWQRAGAVTDVDVRDGVVYAAGPAGAVARRASDGSEFVRYTIDEPHAIAAGDGVVVVRGRRLAAFDATTGADRGWFGGATGSARSARPATAWPARAGPTMRAAPSRSTARDCTSRATRSPPSTCATARACRGRRRCSVARYARWRLPRASWPSAARRAPSTAARASTSPHSTCGPVRSRRSRRASTAPSAALHRVGGVLYAGGEGGLAALDAQTGRAAAVPARELARPRARRIRRHAVRRRRARDARRHAH